MLDSFCLFWGALSSEVFFWEDIFLVLITELELGGFWIK